MKKLKVIALSALAFVTIASTIFVSCKKQTLTNDNQNLNESLQLINKKYEDNTKTRRSWASWAKIGAADCIGGWVGFQAGGKIGALAGPQGATIGAVAGGVILGALNSYGASGMVVHGSGNTINEINSNLELLNPTNNQFDLTVGIRHNILLKDAYLNHLSNNVLQSELFFTSNLLTDAEASFVKSQSTANYQAYVNSKNLTSFDKIKLNITNTIEDATLVNIMNTYIDGIESAGNLENAINLTYSYERTIQSSTQLNEVQKNHLLVGFSISKYSQTFWNNF
jgi:hypothetical protein